MEEEQKTIVLAHLNEGYSFRNSINIIAKLCVDANLIFTRDTITLTQRDKHHTVLVAFSVQTTELKHYDLNCQENSFTIGVNLSELLVATKAIGRKDGVQLYHIENDANLYVQITTSAAGNQPGVNIVPMIDVEKTDFKEIVYQRGENNPNVKLTTSVFSKNCINMGTMKLAGVTFIGYPKGLVMKGITLAGKAGSIIPFGDVADTQTNSSADKSPATSGEGEGTPTLNAEAAKLPDILQRLSLADHKAEGTKEPSKKAPKLVIRRSEDLCTVSAKKDIIKALSKVGNLSANGIIRFYLEERTPLKIVCPVGSYGKLTLYINDSTIG